MMIDRPVSDEDISNGPSMYLDDGDNSMPLGEEDSF